MDSGCYSKRFSGESYRKRYKGAYKEAFREIISFSKPERI